MNSTQLQTTLAPIVGFVAGILAGKNVFGLDATAWTNILLYAIGGVSIVWGTFAARKSALTTTVANLPEVQKVELSGPGAADLAAVTPNNVVVK